MIQTLKTHLIRKDKGLTEQN